MFFSDSQGPCSQPTWRNKQSQFMKESARKDRECIIQSQRYLNSSKIINWKTNLETFKSIVHQSYNHYTLLETLFAIAEEPNWRSYIPQMQILISSFHNIMNQKKGANIQDIVRVKNFQNQFVSLFLLKDLNLHRHLILLLKMMLAYNSKYRFLREETFSEILAESATHNNTENLSQILWISAQIKVTSAGLVRLFKVQKLLVAIQNSDACLLALLTIIANFMSNLNENPQIVGQLISSNIFQSAFKRGIHSSSQEILNQAILIFNNGLCFSQQIRCFFTNDQNTLKKILQSHCHEASNCRQILQILGSPQRMYKDSDVSLEKQEIGLSYSSTQMIN